MQDNFLFDSADPKERGVGCDAICSDDKQLKYKWEWYGNSPCQLTSAKLGCDWELQTIFWHTDYEAEVNFGDKTIKRYYGRFNDEFSDGEVLVTRLDAQLKAEQLFGELVKELADIVEQTYERIE